MFAYVSGHWSVAVAVGTLLVIAVVLFIIGMLGIGTDGDGPDRTAPPAPKGDDDDRHLHDR